MFRIFLISKLANLKSQMQYPADFLIYVLGISIVGFMEVIVVYFYTLSFGDIGGWSFFDICFMSSIWRISHGIHHFFFIAFWWQSRLVKSGEFDRMLLRPISPIIQIMAQGGPMPAIGELIPAVSILIFSITNINVIWSLKSILFLIVIIISGTVIEWSIYLLISAFDFIFIETSGLRGIIGPFLFEATKYPIHIYGKIIVGVMTFVLPYAFIAYYPAHYFLNKEVLMFDNTLIYCSPLVAIIFWGIAMLFWRRGVKKYQSAGT